MDGASGVAALVGVVKRNGLLAEMRAQGPQAELVFWLSSPVNQVVLGLNLGFPLRVTETILETRKVCLFYPKHP